MIQRGLVTHPEPHSVTPDDRCMARAEAAHGDLPGLRGCSARMTSGRKSRMRWTEALVRPLPTLGPSESGSVCSKLAAELRPSQGLISPDTECSRSPARETRSWHQMFFPPGCFCFTGLRQEERKHPRSSHWQRYCVCSQWVREAAHGTHP